MTPPQRPLAASPPRKAAAAARPPARASGRRRRILRKIALSARLPLRSGASRSRSNAGPTPTAIASRSARSAGGAVVPPLPEPHVDSAGRRGDRFTPLPLVPVLCPYCHASFKAPANATHAVCPASRHRLRLVRLSPQEAARRLAHLDLTAAPPAARPPAGEAATRCPKCRSEFFVALSATEATCPGCQAALELDPLEEAVAETRCPVCANVFRVGLSEDRAACPSCRSVLELSRAAP